VNYWNTKYDALRRDTFHLMDTRMTISNLHTLNNMHNVEVIKSNCYGNNFVIYDGINNPILDEAQLPEFSQLVTDSQFGIGADNLLIIQKNTTEQLLAINETHHYWENLPNSDADYVFRMFEPDGEEALCCGNGLMCIANYLFEKYQVESANIITEVPLSRVNETTIGVVQNGAFGWVNLGIPRQVPEEICTEHPSDSYVGDVQTINNIHIKFRERDLLPYTAETELSLSGHLIFSGEPHLVFLLDEEDSAIAGLADAIFARSAGNRGAGPIFQRRHEFGTWFVNRIGQYLNTHYRDRFPIGINVNFARMHRNDSSVEYRCYERGINRETLACGTGAVGVAYVVKSILGWEGNPLKIIPHRCCWFKPQAQMSVTESDDGWTLQGQPSLVAKIDFRLEHSLSQADYPLQQSAN
jgi:diaminopimelate epimerase